MLFAPQELEGSLLEAVLAFAEELKLPEPSGRVEVKLVDRLKDGNRKSSAAPYYLLLRVTGGERNLFSAGYALGQTALFLRFQGIESQILWNVPQGFCGAGRQEGGTAALAFGRAAAGRKPGRRQSAQPQHGCVCRDLGERWDEEVLAGAKSMLPVEGSAVRVMRGEGRLYFAAGAASGKKAAFSEFETGIALANVMVAAEELWVDLEVVCRDDTVSFRGKERRTLASVRQKRAHDLPQPGCVRA